MTTTVIPAQPGWFILHPSMYKGTDEDFAPTDLTAILAWRIVVTDMQRQDGTPFSHTEAYPITCQGEFDDFLVVAPDGSVSSTDCQYETFEHAIDAIRSGKPF
ncbi:hypothetical protein I5E68_07165 [Novosphingobium sp. YJ-S2-02]|uniref:Uncharacterized protein n=1 Tax=Novosphingobium aureum TaxID=2792964 RepID=A0A931HB37_9SPHN|nr:hypothetical protein [Novosphingobium aureum]MBH0112730.1 hypothetical protein [Novosphingobium aureum]